MRQQRPRGSTTLDSVVNAALALADKQGLDAVTIRALAKSAGVPPMSLYTHFANKSALLDLMYAEMSRRLYTDEGHATWQEELRALCHRMRRVLLAHPKWAPLLSRPAPPLAVPMRERILVLMVADGMTNEQAFQSLSSAALVAMGLVLVELMLRTPAGESALENRFRQLRTWTESAEAAAHPTTRAALEKVPHYDLGQTFAVAIAALITGLETQRSKRPPTS